MAFKHAGNPIWNNPVWCITIDIVFDVYLYLGSRPGENNVINRMQRNITFYSAAIKKGFSTDPSSFYSAKNLLAQFVKNVLLAHDLGLLDEPTYLCLREHLGKLIPLLGSKCETEAA